MIEQKEPTSKFNAFMKNAGWQIVSNIVVFVLTVWLLKIHILDFNWLMVILALIMVAITIFVLWYSLRTRSILQTQYQVNVATMKQQYEENIATMKQQVSQFKDEYWQLINQEIKRSEEWKVTFVTVNTKEQNERLEEIRHECLEAIRDAKNAFDSRIINTETNFIGAVNSRDRALDSQTQCLLDILRSELKEMFVTSQLPIEQEDIRTPSQETYNGV